MKLIIAAICSLALTVTGILCVNQLTSVNEDKNDSIYNIQDTQQDTIDEKVQDTEDTAINQDADSTKEHAAPAADAQADNGDDNSALKYDKNTAEKTGDRDTKDNNAKVSNRTKRTEGSKNAATAGKC